MESDKTSIGRWQCPNGHEQLVGVEIPDDVGPLLACPECGSGLTRRTYIDVREVREAISWMGPHGQRSILERLGLDCVGCGAPAGYPPAGPCDNHGTANAAASTGKERPS